jgi:ABC-type transporter Mla MlaB component
MLRITQTETTDGGTTLKLEGRLAGPYVMELRGIAERCLARSQRVQLDLSGVTFVDQGGTALLRELVGRRVEVGGRSTFAAELLGGGGR